MDIRLFIAVIVSFCSLFSSGPETGYLPDHASVPAGPEPEKKASIQQFSAFDLGIHGNGSDQTDKINKALSNKQLKELIFDQADEPIIIKGIVNVPDGKTLCFRNNSRIGGTGTISGGAVDADKHAWIFDRSLTIMLQDTLTQFSVKWYGAKGDGTTDDSEAIRATFEMVRQKGRGLIVFPAGVYIVSQQKEPPKKIIPVYSNTKVRGEGMYNTTIKLASSDVQNFRRVFYLGNSKMDVENVEISDLGIDLSNPFKTYPPPKTFGNDAQSAGIFCYGDPYYVRHAYFHDLYIHDVTGDIIGVSKNSQYITIERVYQKNYLRQGISIGGSGGVDSITVKHIYDLPFTDSVKTGGNSIHTEPYATVNNVSYVNCKISDFSASGIKGLLIDSITTTSATKNSCNNVAQFDIRRCLLNGPLQVSPTGGGVIQDNIINSSIYITSVGGVGFRKMDSITVTNNTVVNTTSSYGIKVEQVSGVSIANNRVTAGENAVVFANAGNGSILNNTLAVSNPKSFGIRTYCTIKSRYGEGSFKIDKNVIKNSEQGIYLAFVSCMIGDNRDDKANLLPQKQLSVKFFPVNILGKQQLDIREMPRWGTWKKGDIIRIKSPAGDYQMICVKEGALYSGDWSSGGSYFANDYVKASDKNIYKAVAAGGEGLDPVSDLSGKYWIKVADAEAEFIRQ